MSLFQGQFFPFCLGVSEGIGLDEKFPIPLMFFQLFLNFVKVSCSRVSHDFIECLDYVTEVFFSLLMFDEGLRFFFGSICELAGLGEGSIHVTIYLEACPATLS